MGWLREQLRGGVLGQGWRASAITLALAALAILVSTWYDALNHGPRVISSHTPIDDLIPLVPALVVPYVTLRPMLYFSALAFALFRARALRSAALSMTVIFLVSYAFYVVLQSYMARPEITGSDTLSSMLRDVYAGDQPYNDFPSLHASLSTMIALHWLRADRRVGVPVALWAALVAISTVFVKQHYLPDLVAGVLLGGAVSLLFLRTATSSAAAPAAPRTPGRPRTSS